MATIEEIKKVILQVAGNPVTGVVKDFADAWAEAIHNLDNPKVKAVVPSAEKRVVEPQETR
jgi:hypothetical protein